MELILERDYKDAEVTLGSLYGFGQRLAYTLEDPVRGNGEAATVAEWKIPGECAIPYGRYRVVVTFSQRFKKHLPLLLDVPGFKGVRLHGGNSPDQTEGCPLLGLSLAGKGIKNCAPAVKRVMDILAKTSGTGEETWLTVCDA